MAKAEWEFIHKPHIHEKVLNKINEIQIRTMLK